MDGIQTPEPFAVWPAIHGEFQLVQGAHFRIGKLSTTTDSEEYDTKC